MPTGSRSPHIPQTYFRPRAVLFERVVLLRRVVRAVLRDGLRRFVVVVRRAGDLRPVDFRAVDLRALDLRVVDFRPDELRDAVLRLVLLRPDVLRPEGLRAVEDLRAVEVLRLVDPLLPAPSRRFVRA